MLKKISANFLIKKRLWITVCIFLGIVVLVLSFMLAKNYGSGKKGTVSQIVSNISEEIFSKSDNATSTASDASSTPQIPAKEQPRRRLDGSLVDKGLENIFPVAVMIENHVDSRPPAALSKANLVYEAEAEGSITRYLAIYASGEKLDRIGPVRSARPYYIDWAKDYGALYVHCGGSPDALTKIKREGIFDLNEFYNGRYFWRDKSRSAPHNVYTSSDKLYGYLDSRKSPSVPDFTSWKYKDDAAGDGIGTTTSITIPANRPAYSVTWKYDRESNSFERYLAGERHKDENGDAISAKNIIIMYLQKTVTDDYGRLSFVTSGTGKAKFCLDGSCIAGKWKKKSGKREIFYYNSGNEISLNSGTTWIEIVPTWGKVEIK